VTSAPVLAARARLAVLVCALLLSCSDEASRPRAPALIEPRLFGVIEGFYGPPYGEAQRLELVTALGALGANAYLYGPKDDPLHRAAWRDDYPESALAHFAEVAAQAKSVGVRFIFAISPGEGFDPESDDPATLIGKIDSLRARGVEDFAIFFDDVQDGTPGADPDVQVEVVLSVRAHLREVEPEGLLVLVPNFYFGTAEQLGSDNPPPFPFSYSVPPSGYYRAYDRIPTDVLTMWTGRSVYSSSVTLAEAEAFRDFTRRPTLLWDNVPVNDAIFVNEPYLGPWVGRDPAIFDALDGVLLNLMPMPIASLVTVETASRAKAEGSSYEPWSAWDATLEARGGDALRAVGEHFQGHAFIGDGMEGGAFAPLAAAFLASPSTSTEAALRAELERLDAHRELFLALEDANLVADLDGPSEKLERLAQAGHFGLDQWLVKESGGDADLAEFAALRTAAESTGWLVGANLQVHQIIAQYVSDGENHPVDHWRTFLDGLEALLAP
jgi:hypothetical protein